MSATTMRVGSLFSGYGGLDMAVEAVTGAQTAWVSDVDAGACKILAHRFPDAPNIGDISLVDWSTVEPVGIVTGGFPCQDVSHAGKRAGLREGTRTGLWSYMRDAIDQLRPSLVVAENVRGLLSAEAASDVEPCPWCLGDGDGEPPMRALGAVLADLADIGYDTQWCGLRAADVGAPHGRFRVFVVAYPAGSRPPAFRDQRAEPPGLRSADATDPRGGVAADSNGLGRQRAGRAWGRRPGLADSGLTAPDADGSGAGRNAGAVPSPVAEVGWPGLDIPAAVNGGHTPTADTEGHEQRERLVSVGQRTQPGRGATGAAAWGIYAPAIGRWEQVLGRPAPAPLRPDGKHGAHRLNPAAVEFLMGLPAGWVMDVPHLTRSEQLKAFGNGVVPQQAAAALRHLLGSLESAA